LSLQWSRNVTRGEIYAIVCSLVHRSCLAGLILLSSAASLFGQITEPRELVTDRPDFTESSEVVGHGIVQIESGLTFEQTDAVLRQMTAPQLLVRVGVGSRFELRFAGDGLVMQSVQAPAGRLHTSGRSDAEIGAKLKLLDAETARVDMAVIPFLSLPTATPGFGSDGVNPGIKLTVARDLPRGFGLSGNVNAARVTSDGGQTWEREASLSVARALRGPVSAYWEAYGTVGDGRCECTVNTGVALAAGPNAQFDVEVGRRVSGDAPRWFVGAGFAIRHAIR
jgi:hypothetical protein